MASELLSNQDFRSSSHRSFSPPNCTQIGDCYLAVAGLPDPRKDHAMIMARFSRDCLDKFHQVTRMLEVTLGPDTADLGLRVGLNSGPVTAGVLR